jgi:hypothetical protein
LTHTVVEDTEAARQARKEQQERAKLRLSDVEESQSARFSTITHMLSWYYGIKDHMASPPAIDPGREIIQGLKVDRDERIFWIGKTLWLLEQLRQKQGNDRGFNLIYLHFRAPVQIGYRQHEGRRVAAFGLPPIPIRELHEHDGEPIGRDATTSDFWRALHLIEEMAVEKGWVGHRLQRRGGGTQVYRRNG